MNRSDIQILSVILKSERAADEPDIRRLVTDIEIFEHLDKPYLTGMLVFHDDNGIMNSYDILGGERIEIVLKADYQNAKEIKKTFYIDRVLSCARSNDHAEAVFLSIIEEHAYVSNLLNINKSYNGTASTILAKIAYNFLSKLVLSSGTDKQLTKLIVPNLNPIEAMSWIKNQTTTIEGFPFYLYSNLVEDTLNFEDLGTMLSSEPVNTVEAPFRYAQTQTNLADEKERARHILQYRSENTENLYSMISQGLIGAKLEYIDLLSDKKNNLKYDIAQDLLGPLTSKNLLNAKNPIFSTDYKLNGKAFNNIKSRTITQIGGNKCFQNGSNNTLSYGENIFASDYKLNFISKAMDEALFKAPLDFTLYGKYFLEGNKCTTIGNTIYLEFANAHPEKNTLLDRKKSGKYLIYSARHMFKKEGYEVAMTGVKLGNEDL